ncbi:MAG: helix-turn-helix transcriptional regulator [Eubacterium sp.]|nr:helix-turn-helix transcriptional regulator [Eubacterium sp.]
MKGWIEGFQESINYIEQNLPEELDVVKIAEKAALSPFYYQRIFGALCGMTVGEYIRARRMTMAAQELSLSDHKVIDIALKYGRSGSRLCRDTLFRAIIHWRFICRRQMILSSRSVIFVFL